MDTMTRELVPNQKDQYCYTLIRGGKFLIAFGDNEGQLDHADTETEYDQIGAALEKLTRAEWAALVGNGVVDISTPAAALGRLGGAASKGKTSARKAVSSARNGAKGGRPRNPAPRREGWGVWQTLGGLDAAGRREWQCYQAAGAYGVIGSGREWQVVHASNGVQVGQRTYRSAAEAQDAAERL